MEENLQSQQNQEVIQTQPQIDRDRSERWTKIVLFILGGLILAGGIFYAGIKYSEREAPRPLVKQPTPTIIPSLQPTKVNQQPTVAGEYPSFSSWKLVDDDFWKIQFKIPSDQSYVKARQRVEPAQIYLVMHSYEESRRQAILKMHRLGSEDVSVQEYTTMKGTPALLIEGITETAKVEGLQYLGAVAYGKNLLTIKGSKEQAPFIKGILDNLEFFGNPVTNTVECTKFDEHWSDYGKTDNGDYFISFHSTKKLDENYIKISGRIFVEAEARIDFKPEPTPFGTPGKTLTKKPVAFVPSLSDYNSPPYVQKLTLLITKEEVIKQIGSDNFNQSDGIAIWVNYRYLKTADGQFCNISSTTGTKTIK